MVSVSRSVLPPTSTRPTSGEQCDRTVGVQRAIAGQLRLQSNTPNRQHVGGPDDIGRVH